MIDMKMQGQIMTKIIFAAIRKRGYLGIRAARLSSDRSRSNSNSSYVLAFGYSEAKSTGFLFYPKFNVSSSSEIY